MTFALAAFAAALAALAYTYAGYPLLLAAWARLAPQPMRRAPFEAPVAIVIVVHNGAQHIGRKLETCLAQEGVPAGLRVLVASDGSTDETCATVEALGDARVRLLAFPERRGKAACLNDAVAACTEDVLVFTDVRQALAPDALRHLLSAFADPRVGAMSGRLDFEREGMSDFGHGIDAYWRYEKALRRTEAQVHSSIGVTGAFYALRRECFRPIAPDTILDDVLIPMNAVLQGRRVGFEDAAVAYDRPSTDAAQERVRKVRTLAGNFQLIARHPRLLSPAHNPVALQFASHKALRLLAPAGLATLLATNIVLATGSAAFAAMLALQAAGYGLALLGAAWPASRRAGPVRLARAFVSLHWFVVLGFVEFVSNPRPHLWSSASRPNHG